MTAHALIHDLNLATRFASHIVLMKNGEITASGPAEHIQSSPALAEAYEVDIELNCTKAGVMTVGASLAGDPG